MDFIPLNPEDAQSLLGALNNNFPFSFVEINNPGDLENENIVFKANKKISCLYDYILVYSIEDTETGLPEYSKCRLLTFDSNIELKKGALLQVYTRKGEDMSTIEFETSNLNFVVYWGLPEAIWNVPHSSYELIQRRDSIGGGLIH